MILVGRNASPFVRRVGVVLQTLGVPYEHKVLSTAKDAEAIKRYNPIAKVPVLVLEDGEHLIESAAIIEAILEMTPNQKLLALSGAARRQTLQLNGPVQIADERRDALLSQRAHALGR